MKIVYLAAIPLILLSACDGGPGLQGGNKSANPQSKISVPLTESANPQSKISVPLKAGHDYNWYRDNSCTDRERETCVSYEDYKALCESASGASKMASMALTTFNRRANYLLTNGDVDEIRVAWRDGYTYGCRMSMQVSGIFQGSSAREGLEGGVSTFIYSEDGKILAHFASETNN
jgi:hypothetical protein